MKNFFLVSGFQEKMMHDICNYLLEKDSGPDKKVREIRVGMDYTIEKLEYIMNDIFIKMILLKILKEKINTIQINL